MNEVQLNTTPEMLVYEMAWNNIEFSNEQLTAIYNSVNAEYKSLDELKQNMLSEHDNYFIDVNLSSIIEFFNDLEDAEIITDVLTMPYGYNGLAADIYYLTDDDVYCAIINYF